MVPRLPPHPPPLPLSPPFPPLVSPLQSAPASTPFLALAPARLYVTGRSRCCLLRRRLAHAFFDCQIHEHLCQIYCSRSPSPFVAPLMRLCRPHYCSTASSPSAAASGCSCSDCRQIRVVRHRSRSVHAPPMWVAPLPIPIDSVPISTLLAPAPPTSCGSPQPLSLLRSPLARRR
jgi:hypothetical protein